MNVLRRVMREIPEVVAVEVELERVGFVEIMIREGKRGHCRQREQVEQRLGA